MNNIAVKPDLELVGHDGNAFSILGRACKVARQAGWTAEEIDEYRSTAMAGDYDALLRTTMEYFNVS